MSTTWNFARRPFQDDRPAFAAAAVLFLVGAVLLVANVRLFAHYRRGVSDVLGEIAALEARQRGAEDKSRAAKAALSSYRLSALADESRELSRLAAERVHRIVQAMDQVAVVGIVDLGPVERDRRHAAPIDLPEDGIVRH